ncbi:hypothetical protein [Phormidium nigroviride]
MDLLSRSRYRIDKVRSLPILMTDEYKQSPPPQTYDLTLVVEVDLLKE